MKTDPEESLGYDNRGPKGQDEYAKAQHDLCCQELGLEPRHDREGDTLLEAVCSLKKDRDEWKDEAALRSKETEVWKHEAETVRKHLESEHEAAIDWFIRYQALKTAMLDILAVPGKASDALDEAEQMEAIARRALDSENK